MPRDFYLTKSAFAVALSCSTKLYYLSNGYPQAGDDDEYLKLLAEGGFIIGAFAQFLFPDGIAAPQSNNHQENFEQTKKLILSGDVTLFEATLLSQRNLALADIIVRSGDIIRLIEVKSKSFDGTNKTPFRTKKGEISSEWMPYLYDIAFQYVIMQRCFPNFTIETSLLLVDKSKRPELDGLPRYFRLDKESSSGRPKVVFTGSKDILIKSGNILSSVDVLAEVTELLPLVKEKIDTFDKAIAEETRIPPRLGKICRDCEFRGDDLAPSGYSECWAGIEKPAHHIFDLFFGTTLKVDGEYLFDQLLAEKKSSLFDVPLEMLQGKRGDRQRVQIEYTQNNKEWVDPLLHSFMKEVRYPLHFIDFETTRTALPFHAGMRPFEQSAFQWSCHTVAAPQAAPVHTEWINTEPCFPNFLFAKALMQTLSKEGTILTWATHEGSVLSDIVEQMTLYRYEDPELLEFLQLLVSSKGSQGRLVDMNRLTLDHYFHPEMKGKTSIKYVFPAIWRQNSVLRKLPWFAPYEVLKDGQVLNPYENLPEMVIGDLNVSVREGTAAMRAYEVMLFGSAASDPTEREKWKKLLLQYCQLDTLAMVAIWQHWGMGQTIAR